MEMIKLVLFLVLITVGTSYCWGMRGTILGGEKGAMLPGAFLGLLLALISGSEFLQQNPYLLAGVGAVAMFCGGNMTYGETLGLSMNSYPPENVKKGLAALFVKGGIWFGLFGGYISLYISVLSGYYSTLALVLFFVFLPVSALIFFFIFNKPYKPSEGKFPRIYFSKTRRETWGGLLGMLIEIIVFAAILKDLSTLVMVAGSVLSGGIGWLIGQIFQIFSKYPAKNGMKFLEDSSIKELIDNWKIMECTLGAVGGLGVSITFLLSHGLFAEKFKILDTNGASSVVSDSFSKILFAVYVIILIADCVQYFVHPSTNKRYYKKLLKMHLITEEGYQKALQAEQTKESDEFKRYKRFCENSEFAIYSIVPMTMCFFGSSDVTITLSFTMLILVLCQRAVEKCFKNNYDPAFGKLILLLPSLVLIILQAITDKPFNLKLMMFVYSFVYEIAYFILMYAETYKSLKRASNKTVHGYFIICCLIMNISTLAI